MYLAILGYLLIAVLLVVLLKSKMLPATAFATLPVIVGLIAGFNLIELSGFVTKGVAGTLNAVGMAVFATVYFAVMTDAGLFDPILNVLSKKTGNDIVAVMLMTSIISSVSHFDTGVSSTVFVTIPAMLPIFKKYGIKVEYLFLVMAQSIAVWNMLPFGGGLMRMSSVTGIEPSTMFRQLIPIIVIMSIYNLVTATLYGLAEKKRLSALSAAGNGHVAEAHVSEEAKPAVSKTRQILNLVLTLAIFGLLFTDKFSAYFIFMMGLALALIINFKNTKDQQETIKKHAASAFNITTIMLASGVLVGIMNGTGMLKEMANVIINLIPESLKNFYAVIVGLIGAPLSIALGADGFYYGLGPLFTKVGVEYGIPALNIACIMIMARDAFGMITPVSPVTFLAPGMLGKELKDFIKFTFKYFALFFAVEMVAGIIIGLVPIL